MIWIFIWLLVSGGSQFSESYATREECEAARQVIARSHVSPNGQPVEKTFACVRLK